MWVLTITQKKAFLTQEGTYELDVEFLSEDISELLNIVDRLSNMETVRETSYKIERVKESEA